MDKVIWLGCILLFATGMLFGCAAAAQSEPAGLGWAEFFAFASAVATSCAAIASWKAVHYANKQSLDASASVRWQMYSTHKASFDDWLNGVEVSQGVKFFNRNELYDVLFPQNRNTNLPFSAIASDELRNWQETFTKLADRACLPAYQSPRAIEVWAADYLRLLCHMRYSFLSPDQEQVYFADYIPSGVSLDNFERVVPVMYLVLTAISKFSYAGKFQYKPGYSQEFKNGFKGFVELTKSGWLGHAYRKGN